MKKLKNVKKKKLPYHEELLAEIEKMPESQVNDFYGFDLLDYIEQHSLQPKLSKTLKK